MTKIGSAICINSFAVVKEAVHIIGNILSIATLEVADYAIKQRCALEMLTYVLNVKDQNP